MLRLYSQDSRLSHKQIRKTRSTDQSVKDNETTAEAAKQTREIRSEDKAWTRQRTVLQVIKQINITYWTTPWYGTDDAPSP